MINFRRAADPVTGCAKRGGQGKVRGDDGAPVAVVFVDVGGERAEAGQQSGAGRVADRSGALRTGEDRAEPGETSQVQCAGWGVIWEEADPVAEVVDGDDDDVGARGFSVAGGGSGDTKKGAGQQDGVDEFQATRGAVGSQRIGTLVDRGPSAWNWRLPENPFLSAGCACDFSADVFLGC